MQLEMRRDSLVDVEDNVKQRQLCQVRRELHGQLPLTGNPRQRPRLLNPLRERLERPRRVEGVEVLVLDALLEEAEDVVGVGTAGGGTLLLLLGLTSAVVHCGTDGRSGGGVAGVVACKRGRSGKHIRRTT